MDAELRTLETGSAEWWAAAQRAGQTRMVGVGECGECAHRERFGFKRARRFCPICNGTGRLERCGVELAAYLGDPGAREFLEIPGVRPAWDGGPDRMGQLSFGDWSRGLEKWGPEVRERAERALDCLLFGPADPHYGWEEGLRSYCEKVSEIKSEAEVRTAIREALVPWLMGLGD